MTTQLKNAISSSFTVDNRFDLVCGETYTTLKFSDSCNIM